MMSAAGKNWRKESAVLLRLAGPLVVNNLAVAGMNTADALMAGHVGVEALASVAVGGSVWFLFFTLGLGLIMAISPISARLFGAGQPELIGRYTRQGIYIGIALGIPIILLAQFVVEPLLTMIGIDITFRADTVSYVRAITLGAPGIFIFLALRFTTEGIGHTRPIMFTSVFGLVCNVFLNYVLVFGHFGVPAMGVVGFGLASAISMWAVAFALAGYMMISPHYEPLRIFSRLAPVRPQVLREILVLGFPIAVTITAEAGLFNAVSILIGTRGPLISAAHQIAIVFASTMFMIPLAMSSAITIRVGQLLGKRDLQGARFSGAAGIFLCGLFMTGSAIILLVFRDVVVSAFTSDAAVKGIALSLLLMAAIFQIVDGIQIGAAGALRGYKDTRFPMVINTFSYWVLAFPLAYMAAVTFRSPPNYIWGGFIVGLTVAAILLSWRFQKVSKSYQLPA